MEKAVAKLVIMALVAIAAIGSVPKMVNADICGITIDQLMTCKPAVQAPDSLPPSECCSALKKIKQPSCLCQYQSYLPALGIDEQAAMQLPKRCKLENAKSFVCP